MTIAHIGSTIACAVILAVLVYNLYPMLRTAFRVVRAPITDERQSYDTELDTIVHDELPSPQEMADLNTRLAPVCERIMSGTKHHA